TRGAVGAAHGATQGCESSLLSTLEPIAGGEPLRRVRGRAVPAVLCQEARPAEPRAGGVFPAAADRVFRGDRFGARDGLAGQRLAGHPALRIDPLEIPDQQQPEIDRKSTRLNSSHQTISYAVLVLRKK